MSRCEKWRQHFEIKSSTLSDPVLEGSSATKSNDLWVIQRPITCFLEQRENIHKHYLLLGQSFVFLRKPPKVSRYRAAALLRLDEESTCHHGDAYEEWCHHDLTAVLSAGSLDTIGIHQPRRSLTFQPVGSLWKMLLQLLNCSRKTPFIAKGKVRRKHKLGVPQPTHLFLQTRENLLCQSAVQELQVPSFLNGTCCFSSSQQEEKELDIVH